MDSYPENDNVRNEIIESCVQKDNTSKTKEIKIAVAIGPDGGFYACADSNESIEASKQSAREFISDESYPGCHVVIVKAIIPLPVVVEVDGIVDTIEQQ